MVTPVKPEMIKTVSLSGLALVATLTACVTPDQVRAAPDDTWTWQVNQNYQRFAHCVTDSLNDAPVHSWFFLAPRPITSFEQQWRTNRIILRSVDPSGVEQVRIEVASVAVEVIMGLPGDTPGNFRRNFERARQLPCALRV